MVLVQKKEVFCLFSHFLHTHTHTHTGILLRHEKEWTNTTCSNMDKPREYHTEWRKSERDTDIIWYHLCVDAKVMIQMNLFTKQKQTQRHRKQIYGYQRGKGVGIN